MIVGTEVMKFSDVYSACACMRDYGRVL